MPVMCWLFPVSVFLFDVISRFVASPGRRRKAEWTSQWMSLAVLPFLLLGITWSYFESWRFIFSAFFWLYVVSRTGCILLFRQPVKTTRPLDQKDALLLMTTVTILNIWSAQPNAFSDVVQAVANGAATAILALFSPAGGSNHLSNKLCRISMAARFRSTGCHLSANARCEQPSFIFSLAVHESSGIPVLFFR